MIHILAGKIVYLVGLISYKIYCKLIGKKEVDINRLYIYALGCVVLYVGILLFSWLLKQF